ncbi:LANO_0G08350g1_1 [Lachancea nothofagi CBS 11611]|uniref:21S rRNA pseudouridine(2819) synthase n=1 Tax=Lachancea nothofagi CBS 11611 TaxID=1266666 RepID=A0A1G4KI25_9SACH|nr:LANO_0G08350g1_1 [Lachancea nothofagi CBS 11611]
MPQNPVVTIVCNCKNYVIANKPAGVFSQMPDRNSWIQKHGVLKPPVLLDMVRSSAHTMNLEAGGWRTVHRLDTNVTGGVLIAKNKQAAALFSRYLRKGGNNGNLLIRKYIALVDGETDCLPARGVLEQDGMKSLFCKIDSRALMLQLCTGKKHQIRLQLSKVLGLPISNDLKYGGVPVPDAGRQIALHSALVQTKVGLQCHKHFIPVVSGRDSLWANYVDQDGHFKPSVQHALLENWDLS